MNALKQAVFDASEASLTALSNKGIYKRACKDIEGISADISLSDETASVSVGGETVTLKHPLAECTCTCVSRTICRHIISAILLAKNALPADASPTSAASSPPPVPLQEAPQATEVVSATAPATTETALSEKQIAKIHQCASDARAALEDLLRNGLVRIPEAAADAIEIAAVRCHTLKMAEAERLLRDLSGRVRDCTERRASFDINLFTKKFCECLQLLEQLSRDDLCAEDLGVFREKYIPYAGKLTLLPIGQRQIAGGEYEGDVYYFLNPDADAEQRFLSVSNVRPTFYNTPNARRSSIAFCPWDLNFTLMRMMKTTMVLENAKINCGRLSTSKETRVTHSSPVNLDCPAIQQMIFQDFQEMLFTMQAKNPENELDRLCFLHPQKCVSAGFDTQSQCYCMTLEDISRRQLSVKVRYRAEQKTFIEQLEAVGTEMLEHPEKPYVLLALAFIENGELLLYPIEFYDFLTPPPISAPSQIAYPNTAFASALLECLDEVRKQVSLVMHCGLQSGIARNIDLEQQAANCGLLGLSQLLAAFQSDAEHYIHSNSRKIKHLTDEMTDILQYLAAASAKLELMTALQAMKG